MGTPRSILKVALSLCVLSALVPAGAHAYATIAPQPRQSPTSGLPDGRIYELASPFNKYGYNAGANPRVATAPDRLDVLFSVASPNGNAVAFRSLGPVAEVDSSGLSRDFVAERTSHGWVSRSATARGLKQNERTGAVFGQVTKWVDYSPDLSHLAYSINAAQVPGAPEHSLANIYLLGTNPLEEPVWLLSSVASPSLEGKLFGGAVLLGMSPDASVVYFGYGEHLLPEDASRSGWGLYEYRNGQLSEVGVLPDGSVPATGAFPAAAATSMEPTYGFGENNPASLDNQLSEDGRRLFFFSSGQLYVHKLEADGSEHSVLVSASQSPGHVGEAAPDGVTLFENLTKAAGKGGTEFSDEKSAPTYAYASSDGSHVFFQSIDRLTDDAPESGGLKVYDFDVDAGRLEYLPDVTLGGIVAAAKDGSSFAFGNGSSSAPELDLWKTGPNGGSVIQITQLPGGGFVGPGRLVADDSVFVFQAQAPIVGFKNSVGEQIYRYDITANELDCVSCPPGGSARSGNAYLSAVDLYQREHMDNDVRGVSSDGSRIFFASPDPLLSRDINGDFDTYEWENGTLFLLSSGTGTDYSPFLDNSESGSDVFFATSDELVEGDNDGGFDVYDARIPHPGDNPPPSAVPCSGDVCQGVPSVPQLLGAPPSATFNGAENIVEERSAPKTGSKSKALSRTQKLAGALKICHKRKSTERAACEKRARKRYGAARVTAKHNRGRGN